MHNPFYLYMKSFTKLEYLKVFYTFFNMIWSQELDFLFSLTKFLDNERLSIIFPHCIPPSLFPLILPAVTICFSFYLLIKCPKIVTAFFLCIRVQNIYVTCCGCSKLTEHWMWLIVYWHQILYSHLQITACF